MAKNKWYRRYIPAGLILKNGNKWWFQISINGKRHRQSLHTDQKSIAGMEAAKIYKELTQDTAQPSLHSIADLIQSYNAHDKANLSPKVPAQRLGHLNNFFEFTGLDNLDDIAPTIINRWLDHLIAETDQEGKPKRGISPKTAVNYRATLSSFCAWAKTRGYLMHNPVTDSYLPKQKPIKIVYMTREEFDIAISKAHELELYAVFFAAYAGLRQAEIYNLTWQNIDLVNRNMSITGKGGKIAAVPISSKLAAVIDELPKLDSVKVFPNITRATAWKYLKPLYPHCPTIAQTGQGWHVFRRTFGSLLVQAGVSIAKVSKLMRHSNISTTEKHYAHLIAEHGREELELL